MSCDLTAGYSLPCRDSMGGATKAYIIQHEHLADATVTVTGLQVTAITLPVGKQAWEFDLDTEKSFGNSNPIGNRENFVRMYDQEVTLILQDRKLETRNLVATLIQKKVAIILKDANGNFELFGFQNGLMLAEGEGGTGTSNEDRNGYTLPFAGREPLDAFIVPANLIPALIIPAVS